MIRYLLLSVALLAATTTRLAAEAARAPVPDFGLMLNEDGDAIFIAGADPDPKVAAQNLEQLLDGLKGQPVRTLVYNIACGSDILHYPTKVGSTWGWRTSAGEKAKPWDNYLPKLRAAAEAGFDSVGVAGHWAKRNGLLFVPSYRMNDSHFCNDPEENVLTGRFWIENHERLSLKRSPIPEIESYQHLLDFSHAEVRAHRLAIIHEASDRYADSMDGFQLDFTRHPSLFPDAATAEQTTVITEMISDVRSHLDELGRKNGRHYPLMVRVQPTLKHCRWVGLDVKTWMKRRLVDVVIPSQAMSLGHDMPVNEFVAIAKPVGAKVYPALLDRTQFAWPFVASPRSESYAGTVSWDTGGQLVRGAVVNYLAMGADGFELYNFNIPLSSASKETIAAAADPTPATGGRVYAVTPRYYMDHTDTYEPPKQIPARLRTARPLKLKLYVGEDLSKPGAVSGHMATALRIGVWLNDQPPSNLGSMTVKLNARTLLDASPLELFTPVTGKQTRSSKHVPPPVEGYIQIPIEKLRMVRQGWNDILIEASPIDQATKYTLCEVQLGVVPRAADANAR